LLYYPLGNEDGEAFAVLKELLVLLHDFKFVANGINFILNKSRSLLVDF
jgi:hypothetical protein